MHRSFENAPAGLTCSECGSKLPITIGEVRRSPMITCTCGVTIEIDGSQLDSGLTRIDRQLDRIPKEITIKL